MFLQFDKTLMTFFFFVAMAGGLSAATTFDGVLGLTATMLFAGVSGAVFILMHTLTALLFARSDTRRALSTRRTPHKNKQMALRDKILKTQLMTASDTKHLKLWMGVFVGGGMRNIDSLRMKLQAAGYAGKNAITGFCIIRAVATVTGLISASSLASAFTDTIALQLAGGAAGAVGAWFFVPSSLAKSSSVRSALVGSGMADAVDILKIYVAAGIHFDVAVVDVIPKLKHISPAVAHEFDILTKELRMTQDRAAAWDRFMLRADSMPVREFVAIMKQSEQDGTPKSAALERLSATLRSERVREAEGKVAKLPILLLIPQFLFAIPALMITVLFSPIYEAYIVFSGLF